MSVRMRVQVWSVLAIATLLAAGLLSVAPGQVQSANAVTSCGSTVYRKADGTAWRCSFGDDFSGSSLSTEKWRVMTSANFNFGKRTDCFVNKPSNVKVEYGVLKLTSRINKTALTCKRGTSTYQTKYTSGMVSTYGKYSQAYGRFEFRAKFPRTAARGIQTSLWLWPEGASGALWPATGEIDVAEWYSQWPDLVIPYLHYATSFLSGNQATNTKCAVKSVQNWHTYLLIWTPTAITIKYDGKTCLNNTSATGAPFNKPYIVSMFQAFGLNQNAPTTGTPAVSTAMFSWVHFWH